MNIIYTNTDNTYRDDTNKYYSDQAILPPNAACLTQSTYTTLLLTVDSVGNQNKEDV